MTELPVVEINDLPRTMDAFVALQERVARTPEGAAALMVLALWLYTEDEESGQQALSAAVDRSRQQPGGGGTDGWRLRNRDLQLIRSQVGGRGYLLRSYVQGSTPENGYRFPELPLRVACSTNPYSGEAGSGEFKVFVACSGADSPRPVTLRRGLAGLWRASEWSSLLLGVREPAVP